MKNQAVMVVSGYNTRAVIAFCRWATLNSVNYHVIAKSNTDPILLTNYKEKVAYITTSDQLSPHFFRSWAKALCQQHGYQRILILPSTEYLNRFLLENRSLIEDSDCIIPLVNVELYKNISDKLSFSNLCQSYGFDVPMEYPGIPERLPFVAKPRTYFSNRGKQLVPHLLVSQRDLKKFLDEEKETDFFFQQFVHGRSLYLLAYISRNMKYSILFSQENLLQQARGGSIILAKQSDFHLNDIAKEYVRMLHNQNFFGLIMVEFRFDEINGTYYMIEANPRLWGPIQFIIDNNVDLFGAFLRDYEFEISTKKISTSHHSATHYFWSGGIMKKSLPLTYYLYSSNDFINDFQMLRTKDIFFRKDTLNLFLKESEMKDYHELF